MKIKKMEVVYESPVFESLTIDESERVALDTEVKTIGNVVNVDIIDSVLLLEIEYGYITPVQMLYDMEAIFKQFQQTAIDKITERNYFKTIRA